MSGEQVQITVAHETDDHPVAFGSLWPAWAIERAICTACKVPWGSVIQIMDEEGVIHVIDGNIPTGTRVTLQLAATSEPVPMSETVKTINVVDADVTGLAPECKFVLVGDGKSGKSSFITSLQGGAVADAYTATSGCDITGMTLQTNRGPVGCKFWDVGGNEAEGGVRDAYYSSAHAAVVFFSFGSLKSYWNVLKWQNEIARVCGPIPLVVVGTGMDLPAAKSGALASTPAMRVACRTGEGALCPLLSLLRTIAADKELALLQDPTMRVSSKATDWHGIAEHICGTFG